MCQEFDAISWEEEKHSYKARGVEFMMLINLRISLLLIEKIIKLEKSKF